VSGDVKTKPGDFWSSPDGPKMRNADNSGWVALPSATHMVELLNHVYWRHNPKYAAHRSPAEREAGYDGCERCKEVLRIVGAE
jgi:hypothetical protein